MTRDFFISGGRRPGKGILAQLGLSLEELIDGVQRLEPERCFAARIAEVSLLERAIEVEHQEERELHLTPLGSERVARLRIRRSTVQGSKRDVLTFKTRLKSEPHNKESSVQAPDGMFEVFELLPGVESNEKTRHVYPTDWETGEVWEVDVFKNADGTLSRWCKVDFEFKGDPHRALPPFPEGLVDIIDSKTSNKEDRAFVDELFQTVFFRKRKRGLVQN